jgi:pimeloyl-ACP methyl ester carboxylesterase
MSEATRTATRPVVTVGTGPGLVLAHGAGGSVHTNFGPVLDGLAAQHTVLGVDFPGSGDTPLPDAPLTADGLADQLVDAAGNAGLTTFAIAGWSLGSAVAIRAAARHPARVRALVLTAPFAAADARLRLAARIWQDLYATGDRPLLLRFLTMTSRGTAALEAMTPEQHEAAARMADRIIPPGTPPQADLVQRIDVRADLPRVAVPTLVISTTGDLLVSPALQRQVAAGIAGAQLAELDTGHLAFAEAPERWSELMTTFLAVHRGGQQWT